LPSGSELPTVRVQNVSVTYRTSVERVPTLKGTLLRMGKREKGIRVVNALRNISFDVQQGTAMGIIGANGAGKSTLMRTMSGILAPTEGRVEVRGKISTLLALGVGFNGALSGRENVVLGGLASGLTREEVEEKYEEIADFAELHDRMDMPMRTYSSGMFSRLAFAVSVTMEPDILYIDEALAAGDARFKTKSFNKIKELCTQARTIFIVSHALATVQELCNDAVWLHGGVLQSRGEPESDQGLHQVPRGGRDPGRARGHLSGAFLRRECGQLRPRRR
jgi:ABC-type polysaccharide/polyol phosphate transport system ATPase subunit